MCLLEKQEIYWKQRAKQYWLQEGDKNSQFFHKFAYTRKEHNSIKKIKDANGVWRESEDEIQDVVIDYFSQLFQSGGEGAWLLERERVCVVTDEQNDSFMRLVTGDEVKCDIFSMFPEKSL